MDDSSRLQTLEDIEAIRTLKYRYCQACDDDHNPDKLGPLFTEDARWEASTMGPAEGRQGIQKLGGLLPTEFHNKEGHKEVLVLHRRCFIIPQRFTCRQQRQHPELLHW